MSIVTLKERQTGASARILTTLGFNCFDFQVPFGNRIVQVLDAVDGFELGTARPSSSGIPILFPFPNRIKQAKYRWKNREYQLAPSDKFGNAIHGLCLDRPWRVIEQRENFVTGQFQLSLDAPDRLSLWPADFIIEVDYELIGFRLRANFRITNPGNQELPWGLGTHPYFKLPISNQGAFDQCTLEAPVDKMWELVDSIPTGKIIPIPEEKQLSDGAYVSLLRLDDVYTSVRCDGPQFDCLLQDETSGLQITQTCPPIFRELVVFTPPHRQAIAVEPYTCPTDAMTLAASGVESGLRILKPDAEFHTWIDISVGEIVC